MKSLDTNVLVYAVSALNGDKEKPPRVEAREPCCLPVAHSLRQMSD